MRRAVAFFLGETGAENWLRDLPDKIERCCEAWHITTREVLLGGVMSCCIKCEDRQGDVCVLKIPLYEEGGALEGAALAAWTASGGVPAVKALDEATGTILMAFIEPGECAVRPQADIIDLIDRLHGTESRVLVANNRFPALSTNVDLRVKWATDRFSIPEYAAGLPYIDAAIKLAQRLLESQRLEPQLLHGDLQGKNLLADATGHLVAIDPLPVVGDVHYDVAFWCVMEETGPSIQANLEFVADRLPYVEYEHLFDWARALAAIELRPYSLQPFTRMVEFLESSKALDDVNR